MLRRGVLLGALGTVGLADDEQCALNVNQFHAGNGTSTPLGTPDQRKPVAAPAECCGQCDNTTACECWAFDHFESLCNLYSKESGYCEGITTTTSTSASLTTIRPDPPQPPATTAAATTTQPDAASTTTTATPPSADSPTTPLRHLPSATFLEADTVVRISDLPMLAKLRGGPEVLTDVEPTPSSSEPTWVTCADFGEKYCVGTNKFRVLNLSIPCTSELDCKSTCCEAQYSCADLLEPCPAGKHLVDDPSSVPCGEDAEHLLSTCCEVRNTTTPEPAPSPVRTCDDFNCSSAYMAKALNKTCHDVACDETQCCKNFTVNMSVKATGPVPGYKGGQGLKKGDQGVITGVKTPGRNAGNYRYTIRVTTELASFADGADAAARDVVATVRGAEMAGLEAEVFTAGRKVHHAGPRPVIPSRQGKYWLWLGPLIAAGVLIPAFTILGLKMKGRGTAGRTQAHDRRSSAASRSYNGIEAAVTPPDSVQASEKRPAEVRARVDAEDNAYVQVPGPADAAVAAHWAWPGATTWRKLAAPPRRVGGFWEFGPLQLELEPEVRIFVGDRTYEDSLKNAVARGPHQGSSSFPPPMPVITSAPPSFTMRRIPGRD